MNTSIKKKMNTIFKIIDKNSQPGKVKLITIPMDDKQIKSVITNNIKIMKAMDAKATEKEEAGKRKKELTAEEKAREAEEKQRKLDLSAELQRLKGVFAKKSTGAKPAEAGGGGISEAKREEPPQEVVEAKAEAKEAVQTAKQAETTDPESLWGDADATLQQLQPAMTALTEELQLIDKSEKVSEETKNKMNRLMVIVDSIKGFDASVKGKFTLGSTVERALQTLKVIEEYLSTGKTGKFEATQTRAETAKTEA